MLQAAIRFGNGERDGTNPVEMNNFGMPRCRNNDLDDLHRLPEALTWSLSRNTRQRRRDSSQSSHTTFKPEPLRFDKNHNQRRAGAVPAVAGGRRHVRDELRSLQGGGVKVSEESTV